jgi:hypothetical protein
MIQFTLQDHRHRRTSTLSRICFYLGRRGVSRADQKLITLVCRPLPDTCSEAIISNYFAMLSYG